MLVAAGWGDGGDGMGLCFISPSRLAPLLHVTGTGLQEQEHKCRKSFEVPAWNSHEVISAFCGQTVVPGPASVKEQTPHLLQGRAAKN